MKTLPTVSSLNLTSDSGQLVMKRELLYQNSDQISFSVALPDDSGELTVDQIHQRSVERVIQLLQDWIAPQ